MALIDWCQKCTFCGRWANYRHNQHVERRGLTPEGDVFVCRDCTPLYAEARTNFFEMVGYDITEE